MQKLAFQKHKNNIRNNKFRSKTNKIFNKHKKWKNYLKTFLTVAYVQRELFYRKISQALCGEPAVPKGRSVARRPRPRFLK